MKGKPVPLKHKKILVEAYLSGMTATEAATLLGYSDDTCYKALKELGFEARPLSVPVEAVQAMATAYQAGLSLMQLATQFGYHADTCSKVLRQQGIKIRTRIPPKEHQDDMVNDYLNGASAKEAAAKFGYDAKVCYASLKRRGLSPRNRLEAVHRRHSVNESFFDLIDTEAKAYWLGFLTADGTINDNRIRLNLKIGDIEHIHKFATDLCSEHPVTFVKVKIKGKIYDQASVAINSQKLVIALRELGVTENKSFSVKPCTKVPEHLQAAYWRGLFDGDGCIAYNGVLRPAWEVSFVGTKEIVSGFANFVGQFVKTNATVRPSSNIFAVAYRGLALPRIIAQALYSNATI